MRKTVKYLLFIFAFLSLSACGKSDKDASEIKQNTELNIKTYPIKKTGQTKSYDENGTEVNDGSLKDDAYYTIGKSVSYTRDDSKEIVTDHFTELEWQDDKNVSSIKKNWLGAQTYCTTLGLDNGEWRLPTRRELVSLSNYGQKDPAIDSIFKNIVSASYWSSTPYADPAADIDDAWFVDFNEHGQFKKNKKNEYHICCVRSEK